MDVREFDYELPKSLIAQCPKEDRASSRLLVFLRKERSIHHECFKNIGKYLRPGDVLVLNNTKVIPAKIEGDRITGGNIELLLVEKKDENSFVCLVKNAGKKVNLEATIGDIKVFL